MTRWEPKSMGRETTFQKDVVDRAVFVEVLGQLSRQVADRLKAEGYRARTVRVTIRLADFETCTRATTLKDATDSPDRIQAAGLECFGRVALTQKVRLVGVHS